jgi:RsiW-degrading membrane proteinase PrsW (M82 family)
MTTSKNPSWWIVLTSFVAGVATSFFALKLADNSKKD